METEYIELLLDAIKEYFGNYEFDELSSRFGLKIEYQDSVPDRKKLITELVTHKYRDKNQKFLEVILSKLLHRCEERILNSTWEVNIFDEQMLPQLKALQNFLAGKNKSLRKAGPINLFFNAQGQLIKFFSRSKTVLMIVDTRIGKTTFDCIRKVQTPVRLLTRQTHQELAEVAGGCLAEFRQRGHEIETRRHLRLNDRFFIFNGHCWSTNCSLVDLGKKTLSIIECVDTQTAVVKEVGRKWREARVYLN
jgi:hypothetical protein